MKKKLKCALFGTGRQATRLMHALEVNSTELLALHSRDKVRGQDFVNQSKFSDAQVYDCILELLNHPGIEAVLIATPDFLHYEQAKLCLEHNKHVYLEKPLGINDEQCQELIELAQSRNLKLHIGYHLQKYNTIRHLKRLLAANYFGKIQDLTINWGFKPASADGWRNESNPWWCGSMLATHCIDLILSFFKNEKIISQMAYKDNQVYQRADDQCDFEFVLSSGARASFHCNLEKETPLSIEFHAEKGYFINRKLTGSEPELTLLNGEIRKFKEKNPWDKMVKSFVRRVDRGVDDDNSLEVYAQNVSRLNTMKWRSR